MKVSNKEKKTTKSPVETLVKAFKVKKRVKKTVVKPPD